MVERMKELTTEELYKIIGKNVAKYRNEKKMSQLALSMALGYKSVSVISAGEIFYKGKHFNLEQLNNISKILKVPITKFFEETD